MGTKKMSKKLALRKNTVAHLSETQMKDARGAGVTAETCVYCDTLNSCIGTLCMVCNSAPLQSCYPCGTLNP
jgi:hypothetical protein